MVRHPAAYFYVCAYEADELARELCITFGLDIYPALVVMEIIISLQYYRNFKQNQRPCNKSS